MSAISLSSRYVLEHLDIYLVILLSCFLECSRVVLFCILFHFCRLVYVICMTFGHEHKEGDNERPGRRR